MMVCLVALVESSTTKVDLVLRESTLALTTTLSNSVTWLLGIFSVSSRSRSAVGLNSTSAALTSYTTTAPPRWRKRGARPLAGYCQYGQPKVRPYLRDRSGECTPAQEGSNIPLR